VSGTGFGLYGAAYGNGLFVAVGSAGNMFTSLGGVTWTANSIASTTYLHSVAFGNGRFVAVGASRGADMTLSLPTICYSTNGTSWVSTVIAATNTSKFDLYSVTFGDGNFVTAAVYAPSLGSVGG